MGDIRVHTVASPDLANWCGTHQIATEGKVVAPGSEGGVQAWLAAADTKIRLLGTRHSWSRLIDSRNALALSTENLTGIADIGSDTVRVRAGTSLADVHAMLRSVGRRLAYSPPVIASQTVAGAIATGTHGQGIAGSTVGDIVTSLRVIDVTGRAREVSRGDPDFGAFILNLGCLGAVVQVTLATLADTVYTCEKIAVSYDEFLGGLHRWNREYPFCKAWWFPDQRLVHLWLVRSATPREQRAFRDNDGKPVQWDARNGRMNQAVAVAIERMKRDTKTRDVRRSRFRTVLRFKNFGNVTGNLNDLLCKGIPAAQINCEIGVPLARVHEALEKLSSWYQEAAPLLHYPIIMRVTGPSRAWLSPAYNRETCYFGFVIYCAEDGTFNTRSFEHLNEVQEILASVGGLPHWGKYFRAELFDFSACDRWDDFVSARSRYDPDRRLCGDFLASIPSFATPSPPGREEIQ